MKLRAILRSVFAASVIALAATTSHANEFINVLTGGTSGVYYPLGVSLTQIYGKVMPNAKSTVQAAKAIDKNTAGKGSPVPLRPGAEKYYREAGLIK